MSIKLLIISMPTIPIQLNEAELQKIDYLIRIGRYKNRNQAIKAMLNERLVRESYLFAFESAEEDQVRRKVVEKLLGKPDISFKNLTKKSAVELVSEERERS